VRGLFQILPRLWANWITLTGSILTTISGVAILVELIPSGANVYSSSFLAVVLPLLFAAGLVGVAFGAWIDRRTRARRTVEPDAIVEAFEKAIHDPRARARIVFVFVVTLVNILLFSFAGHSAMSYMDSPKFCGTACHATMQPEWVGYNRSSHARVACVQCHIGPGASWELKAKLNGLHQVWALATNTKHRPVPTPVEELRPSRDTCEQCHWPKKLVGDQLRLFAHHKDDEQNTTQVNALLVHVGGEDPRTGQSHGIHWHADHEVRYEILDRERTQIGKITVYGNGQPKLVYQPKTTARALGERIFDCMDCHNRPAHAVDASPQAAVDEAMNAGLFDVKIPFLVQVSVALLAAAQPPRDQADRYFRSALGAEYAKSHPAVKLPAGALDRAAAALATLYRRNVFPEMKVGFGTYRSQLGHQGGGGCFRCHDKEHEATLPDGSKQTMSQDCDSCHDRLAVDEDPKNLDDTMKSLLH
jgi:nitrate/TMAO reductase-like tetraheme cytochrome c subunit